MEERYARKWAILAAVTLASFISNVDGTIVVLGLPKLTGDLHMSVVTGVWVITSYMITSTVLLLPAGRWADSIGTKRIFLSGLCIFTVSTLFCGLANSGALLVIFRLIQGAGGAFAMATATPIIVQAFPQKELGRAIGVNSTSWVLGSIVGPVAGGALISTLGWRSMFFVTVPFALVGLLGAWVVLKDADQNDPVKTDWFGIASFGSGLVALLVALSEGPSFGWTSGTTLGLFAAAALLWGVFVVMELRVQHPLFQFHLLSNRDYTAGLAITLFYLIGYCATTFLLTLYLQGALRLSPLDAGLLMIPLSAPQLILGPFGGTLADRYGPARVLITGLLFLALGALLLGYLPSTLSIAWVVIPLGLMSAANSLAWPSLTKAVLSAAPREQTGSASGMFYTVRNIGMALSQALAWVVTEQGLPPSEATQTLFGGQSVSQPSMALTVVHATDVSFRFFTVFFVLAMVIGFLLVRPKQTHATSAKRRLVSDKSDVKPCIHGRAMENHSGGK